MPTKKGLAEGVNITVSWTDGSGDERHKVIRVPPKDIREGLDAVAVRARGDGYRAGFAAGQKAAAPAATPPEEAGLQEPGSPGRAEGERGATKPEAPARPSRTRRLEIIAHKQEQIDRERAALEHMMGRSTDDAIINKYLDAKAALDDRDQILPGELRAIELEAKRPPASLQSPKPDDR